MQARSLQIEMARFPSFIPMFRVCVHVRMIRRGSWLIAESRFTSLLAVARYVRFYVNTFITFVGSLLPVLISICSHGSCLSYCLYACMYGSMYVRMYVCWLSAQLVHSSVSSYVYRSDLSYFNNSGVFFCISGSMYVKRVALGHSRVFLSIAVSRLIRVSFCIHVFVYFCLYVCLAGFCIDSSVSFFFPSE